MERFHPMRQPLFGRPNNAGNRMVNAKHENLLPQKPALQQQAHSASESNLQGVNTAPPQLHQGRTDGENDGATNRPCPKQNYIPLSAIPAKRSEEVFAAERAIVKQFDPITGIWEQGELLIQIHRKPFADGSMRAAYKMKVLSGLDVRGSERQWVAKLSKDMEEDPRQYAKDVEMQMESRIWADQYNKLGVPKHVEFLEAFVAVLPDRTGSPSCLIERFVEGRYEKWNDNWDWSDDRRNTPQAFSHWSWEASGHRQLICDLQGVGDVWTDPQIHTIDGHGYGRGNAGLQGVRKFFLKHTCNGICGALGLKSITGRVKGDKDYGTQWGVGAKAQQRKRERELHSASVGMTVDGGAGGGITLPLLVVSVHMGGPAHEAGLQRGDAIIAIDGQNVFGFSADDVKKMLSGPSGTRVTVLLKSGSRNVEVSLVRIEGGAVRQPEGCLPQQAQAPPRRVDRPPPRNAAVGERAHEYEGLKRAKPEEAPEDEPSGAHARQGVPKWMVGNNKLGVPAYKNTKAEQGWGGHACTAVAKDLGATSDAPPQARREGPPQPPPRRRRAAAAPQMGRALSPCLRRAGAAPQIVEEEEAETMLL